MKTSQFIFPMKDQHRATEGEWYCIQARDSGKLNVAYSGILELLHRIEALEAAADRAASEAFRAASTEIRPNEVAATTAKSNHPETPDSSLVEQVTDALVDVEAIDEDDDDPTYKYTSDAIRNGEGVIHLQARAAIRVIASELRAQGFVYAADWLEQEAER